MNQWANTVLTDKGVALLAKLTQGNTLNITRAMTGAGFVTPGLLQKQTEVTNPKQPLSFLPVAYPETGTCAITMSLRNDGLTNGYEATQVGVFATDPDDGEILLFISQAVDAESGTIIPSETEMAGYSAEWTFYFKYGQADVVNVTVDPSNTVSRAAMESYVTGRIGSLTKENVGLGNVDNTSDAEKPVSTAQAAAIAEAKKAGTDAQTAADEAARLAGAAQTTAEGKEDKGTAASAVNAHNTDTAAHNDLRLELQALTNRINAFLDSDDATLDELSEIIAYINSNKELIDAITTSKVSVTDIVDNLVTNVANKPLSAAQGVVLKGLIDTLQTAVNGKAPTGHKHTKSEITDFPTSMTPTAHNHSVNDVTGAAKLQSPNDMLHNGNEFTFIPDGYEGQVYINHRTASGQTNGNVSNYYFCDGKGGLATFIAAYFKGKFQGDTARLIYNNEEVAMLDDVPTKTETLNITYDDGSTRTLEVYVK